MKKYGVLIVDDSAVMRKKLSSIIESSSKFYVIGKARNGLDTLEKMDRLKPDIVLLDAEIPELQELNLMENVELDNFIPIIMLEEALGSREEAMQLGIHDFVFKSELLNGNDQYLIDFYKLLENAIQTKSPIIMEQTITSEVEIENNHVENEINNKLLVIGSSTGGPAALQKILVNIPKTMRVPIVIVQHMPPGFTKSLAERFNSICEVEVKEAEHQEILQRGTVYIAPAGIQTLVKRNKDGQYYFNQRTETDYSTLYKPSIDVMLLSVAEIAKDQLLTVILTGMGDDGLRGCRSVKANGGYILAESEESCVVYGMPKVVSQAELVDKQLPIHHLAEEILTHIL